MSDVDAAFAAKSPTAELEDENMYHSLLAPQRSDIANISVYELLVSLRQEMNRQNARTTDFQARMIQLLPELSHTNSSSGCGANQLRNGHHLHSGGGIGGTQYSSSHSGGGGGGMMNSSGSDAHYQHYPSSTAAPRPFRSRSAGGGGGQCDDDPNMMTMHHSGNRRQSLASRYSITSRFSSRAQLTRAASMGHQQATAILQSGSADLAFGPGSKGDFGVPNDPSGGLDDADEERTEDDEDQSGGKKVDGGGGQATTTDSSHDDVKKTPSGVPIPGGAPAPTGTSGAHHTAVAKTSRKRAQAPQVTARTDETYNLDAFRIAVQDGLFILVALVTGIITLSLIHPRFRYAIDSVFPPDWVIAWFCVAEVFTIAWMSQRFRVRVRKGDWEVLDTLDAVRKHYLKTWFFFDLVYALPLEFIFISWANNIFYYSLSRHFLRCIRVISLGGSSNPLVEARSWFQFLSYCAAVVFAVDAIANVFFAIESDNSFMDSLYWAAATLTSVGYGDIVVSPGRNRAFAVFSCVCGVLLIASLTAYATSFLTAKDILTEELDRKKKMMYSMLNYYSIPWDVQKQVISMFPTVLDSESEMQFKTMMEALPPFVAQKIVQYLRAKILVAVPLFKDLRDSEVVLKLSGKMTQRFAAPYDYVIVAGDRGEEMFFLVRGVVDVLIPIGDEDRVVATLRSGSWFGEIALLEHCVRTASIQSMVGCELLVLTRQDFEEIVPQSAELQLRIAEHAKARRAAMKLNGQAPPSPKDPPPSKPNPVASTPAPAVVVEEKKSETSAAGGSPSSANKKQQQESSAASPLAPDRSMLATSATMAPIAMPPSGNKTVSNGVTLNTTTSSLVSGPGSSGSPRAPGRRAHFQESTSNNDGDQQEPASSDPPAGEGAKRSGGGGAEGENTPNNVSAFFHSQNDDSTNNRNQQNVRFSSLKSAASSGDPPVEVVQASRTPPSHEGIGGGASSTVNPLQKPSKYRDIVMANDDTTTGNNTTAAAPAATVVVGSQSLPVAATGGDLVHFSPLNNTADSLPLHAASAS